MKRSISAARRLKPSKTWLHYVTKQPQRENGQAFQVNETREHYDAAVHGYTFLLLTPFSFVKLFKKMLDELQLYQKILSRHQVNHF